MELLDVLYDDKENKYYLNVNSKEFMTENGEYITKNKLDNIINIIKIGNIHRQERLVRLFDIV
ncbi:MAG: hypothetical protein RR342_01245 [Bacilli bacterium]|jgi:hypothetical protein